MLGIENARGGLPWLSHGWDLVFSLQGPLGLTPGQGTKILQAMWYYQKNKIM